MLFLVTLAALVAAGLARPSLLWTRLLFTFTVAFLGWSLVGAIATQGQRRVFWIAAATFGLGYFWLLTGESPSYESGRVQLRRVLITEHALEWTARVMGHHDFYGESSAEPWDGGLVYDNERSAMSPTLHSLPTPMPPQRFAPNAAPLLRISPPPADAATDDFERTDPENYRLYGENEAPSIIFGNPPANTLPTPSGAYFPSPGKHSKFLVCGHCGFLILIALCGGALAQWAFASAEKKKEETAGASPAARS